MTRTLTTEYLSLTKETLIHHEDNDCAVKAVALVTGYSYAVAHSTFKKLGRKDKAPTPKTMIPNALALLGKKTRPVNVTKEIIHQYPGAHKNKLQATTHQPARFPRAWKNGKTYLAYTNGHILAIINGQVHDWTSTKSVRITRLIEVI